MPVRQVPSMSWKQVMEKPELARLLLVGHKAILIRRCSNAESAHQLIARLTDTIQVVQPTGEMITTVTPMQEQALRSDAQSAGPLDIHVDGNSLPVPVAYVALYCEHPGFGLPAPTLMAPVDKLVQSLPLSLLDVMATRAYEFTHTWDKDGKAHCVAPILSASRGQLHTRYSRNVLMVSESSPDRRAKVIADQQTKRICLAIAKFCANPVHQSSATLGRGDLLLADNQALFHWRSQKASPGRLLKRTWWSYLP